MSREKEIISQLIKGFQDIVPNGKVISKQLSKKTKPYDLALDVQINKTRKRFICEVKSVGEPRYLYQAIGQLKLGIPPTAGDVYPVIVAPYISEQGRNICKEAGVGFIDLQGNVFLKFNNILIDVRPGLRVRANDRVAVADRVSVKRERKTLRRLFSPVSSRVMRVMLENPKEVWTLKVLSAAAKASLKQTYLVTNALDEKGFVDKKRGAITLTKPGELLDLWANNYNITINEIQTFYSFEKTPASLMKKVSRIAKENDLQYAFTLHAGASLVAPFVRFTDVHFYIVGSPDIWVKKLDLRPVEYGGAVHLIIPYDEGVFYNKQVVEDMVVVPNTQLYLDLYNYPARGREQANFLRKQKLSF
ncbi:MAG: type IV toxin-antitoxin system AbiEi family antitoxin [Actinomycetota bacterium]|nr:type IV toxin-antitoxin system AbiEi family antitoxin [Actinomycetota bacterium]